MIVGMNGHFLHKTVPVAPRPYRSLALRLPLLLLVPLGFGLPSFFSTRMDWVETVYCARIYPAVHGALSALTGWFSFSLAEWLLYALVLGAAVLLLVQLIRAACRRIPLHRFLRVLLCIGIAGGVLLNLFYLTWGLCYFRQPLAARMELPVAARPVEELASLTELLARRAAALRQDVQEDADGVFTADMGAAFAALPDAYDALAQEFPVFSGRVTQAKRVCWSEGLSWLGIAGVYVGLTAEPNVNIHQPPLLIPAGAAHETAHQLGLASENEAEFAAFLSCAVSSDAAVRYSGAMHALLLCGNALARADAARYAEIVRTCYTDGMRRDLADYSAYWDAYEGKAQEAATSVNDNYLKHNAQPSGVASYGESVDLLLAFEAKTSFFARLTQP